MSNIQLTSFFNDLTNYLKKNAEIPQEKIAEDKNTQDHVPPKGRPVCFQYSLFSAQAQLVGRPNGLELVL